MLEDKAKKVSKPGNITRMFSRKPLGKLNLGNLRIPMKAFLLGVIIRTAMEVAAGRFPVGYDPSTHYVLMCVCGRWEYIISAPLYSIFLYLLYLIIGDALIAVKIGSIIVSGLFMFSVAYWAQKCGVSEDRILGFVCYVYTFFVVLRILWDLHRNAVGIAFSFLALAFYRERKEMAAFVLSILAGLAHPLSLVFLGGGILYDLLVVPNRRSIIVGLGVSVGVGIIVLLKVIMERFSLIHVIQSYWYVSRSELLLYIPWLFAPLLVIMLPVLCRNLRRMRDLLLSEENKRLLVWAATILLLSFILKYTYRIVFLASFPLLIYMFKVVGGGQGKRGLIRILIVYNIVVSAVYPAFFYIYPIRDPFRKTHPPVLIAGNMFPEQEHVAEQLFRKALQILNNESTIIIHHSEISYAYAAGVPLCADNVLVMRPDESFEKYLDMASDRGFRIAYIVWYVNAPVGSIEAPKNGHIVESMCDLALYLYNLSAM